MAHGVRKGELASSFKKRIADLQQKAQKQSAQFRENNTARPWHTPDAMADSNLLDVPNLHEPSWNRDDANKIYSTEVLSFSKGDIGTAGDIASLKKQISFMAAEERAWRLRHASLARCASLAHGRLAAHANETYGIFAAVKNVVDNHLIDGTDSRGQDAESGKAGANVAEGTMIA